MNVDPRQPVLVGIGTCMQCEDSLARSGAGSSALLGPLLVPGEEAVFALTAL